MLGPTPDGRLFLRGRRKQRTRIRSIEIISNETPKHPSIDSTVIDDGMGEFHLNVTSIRQRFLEALRLRSEHEASIDEDERETIAARLIALVLHDTTEFSYQREKSEAIGTQKRYPALTLTVIHAEERGAPKNRKEVNWKLINDLPVQVPQGRR
jgi:hypothetical protein